MATDKLLLLVTGVTILAALVVLWRLRPTTAQGLWMAGGMFLGLLVAGIMAANYRWAVGHGQMNWLVFVLGGGLVGWAVTKLFRIK